MSFKTMRISRSLLLSLYLQCLVITTRLPSIDGHNHHHRHLETDTFSRCDTPDAGAIGEIAINTAVEAFRQKPMLQRRDFSITVPLCFHTLYPSGGAPLTDEKLQSALDHLNQAFSSSSCCDETLDWCNSTVVDNLCSAETQISFAFAQLVDNAVTSDTTVGTSVSAMDACVTRTENNNWFNHVRQLDEKPMKQALYKGDRRVLNVYFVQLSNRLGYATYPFNEEGNLDGVVVAFNTLPGDDGPYGEGDTLVHEVGHWLGLPHVFQGGCTISDGILDTATALFPYFGCSPLPNRPNTCPEDDGLDPIFNFMDYSNDECLYEFTAGQQEVMLAMWDFYRLGNKSSDIIQLTLGIPSVPISVVPKSKQLYALQTERCGVTCTLSGSDEGNADMFVEYNREPQFNDNDSCISDLIGNEELCRLESGRTTDGRFIGRFLCGNQRRPKCIDGQRNTIYIGIEARGVTTSQNLVVTCLLNS